MENPLARLPTAEAWNERPMSLPLLADGPATFRFASAAPPDAKVLSTSLNTS